MLKFSSKTAVYFLSSLAKEVFLNIEETIKMMYECDHVFIRVHTAQDIQKDYYLTCKGTASHVACLNN